MFFETIVCKRISRRAHLKCSLVDTVPCNLSLDTDSTGTPSFYYIVTKDYYFVLLHFNLVPVFNLKRGDVFGDLLPAMVPSSCKMELVHSVGLPNTTSAFFLNPAKTGVLQSSVPILATTALGREERSGESGGGNSPAIKQYTEDRNLSI